MTVRREHLTFSKILSHFLPTPSNAKMENMQTAVAVRKVWLLCENSRAQLRVSAPSLCELLLTDPALLCSRTKALGVTFRRPASPANWGLYRAQQSTPHPTLSWRGQEEGEIAGPCAVCLVGCRQKKWNLGLKTELQNLELTTGCTERKTVR